MAAKKSPTKKPAAVPALLEQLERALKKRYPSVHETLRPGLDAKGVERLSRCVSKKLPPDFVALYRWHDGVSGEELFQEWGLLPLSDVEREQRTLRRAARATFGGETLAFMSNFAGDLLYLDLAGVLGGKPGQVLAWRHEEPKAPEVVFANVRQLVLTMAEAAKKGLLLPDDDEDAFERLYTRLNPHRGDGDLKAILKAIEKTSEPKKRLALTDRALALDRKNRDVWRARSDALSDLDRDEEAADALAEEIALTKEPFMRARLGVRRAELLNYAGCHQRARCRDKRRRWRSAPRGRARLRDLRAKLGRQPHDLRDREGARARVAPGVRDLTGRGRGEHDQGVLVAYGPPGAVAEVLGLEYPVPALADDPVGAARLAVRERGGHARGPGHVLADPRGEARGLGARPAGEQADVDLGEVQRELGLAGAG